MPSAAKPAAVITSARARSTSRRMIGIPASASISPATPLAIRLPVNFGTAPPFRCAGGTMHRSARWLAAESATCWASVSLMAEVEFVVMVVALLRLVRQPFAGTTTTPRGDRPQRGDLNQAFVCGSDRLVAIGKLLHPSVQPCPRVQEMLHLAELRLDASRPRRIRALVPILPLRCHRRPA
ncbi:MAG: hypothetical protein FD152_2976 [Xanthobacteraceae bacterium]|nr:MAG: hypothetical protein FD152_2976 [Xanthobacteraceae bacterium]